MFFLGGLMHQDFRRYFSGEVSAVDLLGNGGKACVVQNPSNNNWVGPSEQFAAFFQRVFSCIFWVLESGPLHDLTVNLTIQMVIFPWRTVE